MENSLYSFYFALLLFRTVEGICCQVRFCWEKPIIWWEFRCPRQDMTWPKQHNYPCWHPFLIVLYIYRRRETTTYIKHIYIFDRCFYLKQLALHLEFFVVDSFMHSHHALLFELHYAGFLISQKIKYIFR